jgi:hypothetical protein
MQHTHQNCAGKKERRPCEETHSSILDIRKHYAEKAQVLAVSIDEFKLELDLLEMHVRPRAGEEYWPSLAYRPAARCGNDKTLTYGTTSTSLTRDNFISLFDSANSRMPRLIRVSAP